MNDTPEIAPTARQKDVPNANFPDTVPIPDADRARSALIEAAAAVLAKRNADIPPDFLAAMFGQTAPEDFARYRP